MPPVLEDDLNDCAQTAPLMPIPPVRTSAPVEDEVDAVELVNAWVPDQLKFAPVLTATSSALTVMPVPAPTASVRSAERSPPPVRPPPETTCRELASSVPEVG